MTITTEPIYKQTWGIPITAPRTCQVYHHDVVLPPRHATRALSTAADLVRETTARGEHLIVHMSAQVAQSRTDPARGRMQLTVRHISDSPTTLAAIMIGVNPESAPLPSGEGRRGRTQSAVSLGHVLEWAVAGFRQGVDLDDLDDLIASTLAATPGSPPRRAVRSLPVDRPVIDAVSLHLVRRGMEAAAHWVVTDDLPHVLSLVKEALGHAFVVEPNRDTRAPLGHVDERLAVVGIVTGAARCRALWTTDGYLVTATTHLGHVGDIAYVKGTVVERAHTAFGPETVVDTRARLA